MTYDATKLRRAPVQPSRGVPFPTSVAWHFHERAWSQYAACFGRSQSAERIAERGGFSAMELVMFMLGKDPGSGRPTDAEIAAVRAEVEAYDSELTAARADVDRLTRELAEAREPGPSFGITWQLAAEERERSFLAERARAESMARQMQFQHADTGGYGSDEEAGSPDYQLADDDLPKVGRNDPCPCGSGKKYKHCHGKLS